MPTSLPRNLDTLSYAQLQDVERRIEAAKATQYAKATSDLAQLRVKFGAKLAEAARSLGLPAEAAPIVIDAPKANGKGHKRKSKGIVAIKYRDPSNPGNTWTGRGRAPRWLAAAEKSGRTREAFRI